MNIIEKEKIKKWVLENIKYHECGNRLLVVVPCSFKKFIGEPYYHCEKCNKDILDKEVSIIEKNLALIQLNYVFNNLDIIKK